MGQMKKTYIFILPQQKLDANPTPNSILSRMTDASHGIQVPARHRSHK